MKKVKEWFNGLSPETKRKVVMITAGSFFVVVMLIAYNAKKSNEEPTLEVNVPKKERAVDFTSKDDDLALRLGLKNQLEQIETQKNEQLKAQAEEIEKLKEMMNSLSKGGIPGEQAASQYGDLTLNGVPPPPGGYANDYMPQGEPPKPVPPIVINGGIGSVNVPVKKISATAAETGSGDNATAAKKTLKNFIPAGSILKATLLNGMYAPTMGKGNNSPYPALMRLWDMGFLPNEVRKDLSGCFVLGEAYGELSDSRVHIRLDKLSCISNNEKRVLEKGIKGFVNGDDGKVGIYGEIRANFGKVALAALLAEFLSAAGETIKSASQNVVQNPLGGITTTYPKTEDILASAAGSGFGEAASMIAEFYINIMKEMSPVIEISGRRDVEIIISNGIELTLDDFEWLGVKTDEKQDLSDIIN